MIVSRVLVGLGFLFLAACATSNHNHGMTDAQQMEEMKKRDERLSALIFEGKIVFQGGDGSTMENAVIIDGVQGESEGVPTEYLLIASKHGKRGLDWNLDTQSTSHQEKRVYDILIIERIRDSAKFTHYFDITNFYGK